MFFPWKKGMERAQIDPYSKPQESLAATKAFSLQISDAALLFRGPGAGFPRRLQQVPDAEEDLFPTGLTMGAPRHGYFFSFPCRNCLC